MIFFTLTVLTLMASYFLYHSKKIMTKDMITLILGVILFIAAPMVIYQIQDPAGRQTSGTIFQATPGDRIENSTSVGGDSHSWKDWFRSLSGEDYLKAVVCWLLMMLGIITRITIKFLKNLKKVSKSEAKPPSLWLEFAIPLILSAPLTWFFILNLDNCLQVPQAMFFSYQNGLMWDTLYKQIRG